VLVGGVDGTGTVDSETVVVGLVISSKGFFRRPLPNGTFLRFAIGFCADILAIWGLMFPFSVAGAVLAVVETTGVDWFPSALVFDDDDEAEVVAELLMLDSSRKFV
jgi:hypothetical protein